MQKRTYLYTGITPGMLHHNGQGIDPTNDLAKQLKAATGKTKKSDADLERVAEAEFYLGLYANEQGPIIPADVIVANIINGAKKVKEGGLAKIGVFIEGDVPLLYDGPRNPSELYAAGFYLRKSVKIGGKSIMRTRPLFKVWNAKVTLVFDPDIVNPERLDEWVDKAGAYHGLGDWRPRYGRFTVEVC